MLLWIATRCVGDNQGRNLPLAQRIFFHASDRPESSGQCMRQVRLSLGPSCPATACHSPGRLSRALPRRFSHLGQELGDTTSLA